MNPLRGTIKFIKAGENERKKAVKEMPGGMGWGRGRGRRRKMRMIGFIPQVKHFYPALPPMVPPKPPIFMSYEEFEALRLVDYEGLTQEEAGKRMGVSRGTVWRALSSARKKVAQMIVEGRELVILPQGNEAPKMEE
ncbi:hypothetical protein TAM4_2470 [Thermococcus sp. AM4]|nr:hypothetical protein TAM4_2470 [Thermococcus sp. AM4]